MRANSRVAYLYILPGFLVFALFVLGPLGHTAWLSLYDWDGITLGTWTGLDNYTEQLADPDVRTAFSHSMVFLFFFAALPVGLGLVLASVLSRFRLRGLGFFRTVIFLPQVATAVVVGIAWRWMYADEGTINQLLSAVGLDGLARAWLGDFTWALPALGLVGTWVMSGLCMVLFLAGISKIDASLYEAARVDGAGPVREFFAVTLPGLKQEMAVGLTLTTIAALRSFDLVYVTTGGGPGNATNVPGFEIYKLAFRQGAVGEACAVAVMLTVLIFTVVLLITRLLREKL
ncbi:carbohydrate ABC transporter permease [Nonomuraea basaltis]|uniref:carbohydrate ABC transporter permease n=1 Tax=Nonomuraea basaltis TaxID=2495887 RepID=UPI00110C57C3|nr:sugar ABC transporter permease [Nonomuraea basaltis]TMR94127.1 sugar ABC transporter permease [Nonomuraea basaltis]